MISALARSLGYLLYGAVIVTTLCLLGVLGEHAVRSTVDWVCRGQR